MLKKWTIAAFTVAILIANPLHNRAGAADSDASLAAGEAETKQLLRLMDRDENGKVSKQEFLSFMESEFERLDINKDGELDVNELIQIRRQGYGGTSHR